jgi:transcriptional regulator with XRE-family HTH domain/predicted transcriptional regulator
MNPQDRSRITTAIYTALNLRRLRRASGLDRTTICKRALISSSYYGELEAGDAVMTTPVLSRLCKAFGVSQSDIDTHTLDPVIDVFLDLTDDKTLDEAEILERPGEKTAENRKHTKYRKRIFPIVREVIELLDSAPNLANAFTKTVNNIARERDIGSKKEVFLPILLRTHQEEHHNYFAFLEDAAQAFLDKYGQPVTYEGLRDLLKGEYHYGEIEPWNFGIDDDNGTPEPILRSVWFERNGKYCLRLNEKLKESQRTFEVAKEIGYHWPGVMRSTQDALAQRNPTSSWTEVSSFPQVLNDFRASYFAGALLMPQERLEEELRTFFGKTSFDPAALAAMIRGNHVTPEMYLHRLSEILPGRFGIKNLHFLRFQTDASKTYAAATERFERVFRRTKYLNLDSLPFQYAESPSEKYCRLYGAIKIFKEFQQAEAEKQALETHDDDDFFYVKAQRSRFLKEIAPEGYEEQGYLCISVARRLNVQEHILSSVTLGFVLTPHFQNTVAFWNDHNNIEFGDEGKGVPVAHTCQRCPKNPCTERAASPSLYEDEQQRQHTAKLRQKIIDATIGGKA